MLKSNLFKLKKNKRYNYTPRYYKGKEKAISTTLIQNFQNIEKHIIKTILDNNGKKLEFK